jgi:hypothetical protein
VDNWRVVSEIRPDGTQDFYAVSTASATARLFQLCHAAGAPAQVAAMR